MGSKKKKLSIPENTPAKELTPRRKINWGYLIIWILDLVLLFPFSGKNHRWHGHVHLFLTALVRGLILYLLFFTKGGNHFHEYCMTTFTFEDSFSIKAIFWNVFCLAFVLSDLWYFITSLLLILAIFYYFKNFTDAPTPSLLEDDFDEIKKFKSWRDNKMKFMDYPTAAKLMSDTAVLNNLDENDEEARKVLSYLNNKMRFQSYTDSLKMLQGKK